MTKHIAIDARGYSTSTGRYVRKLIENLEKLDNDSRYSILLKSRDWNKYEPSGNNFTKIRADFTEFTFAEQLGFKRLINKLGVDLVHFTMPNQPIFYGGKKVTTIHDLTRLEFDNPASNLSFYTLRKHVFKYVIRRAARQSSKVITPSKFIGDKIVEFTDIESDKIIVTYEAADRITEPTEEVEPLRGKKFIMYVGQPFPHKNLKRLIRAHSELSKNYLDLYLVLAGKTNSNYRLLKEWARENDYKNVIFTGFVDDSQLRWLYENAECYVFPSLSEGFGLPGLEAMAHNCPLVSSNATCLPEIYGGAAHYFDPRDISDMTKKIQEVLDDEKLRNQLISSGKKQLGKYSWEKMARQTLEVYRSVLS